MKRKNNQLRICLLVLFSLAGHFLALARFTVGNYQGYSSSSLISVQVYSGISQENQLKQNKTPPSAELRKEKKKAKPKKKSLSEKEPSSLKDLSSGDSSQDSLSTSLAPALSSGNPWGKVSTPKCQYCPKPSYPLLARQQGISGVVKFLVQVDAEGKPAEIQLLSSSGSKLLDRKARRTIKFWRFIPAYKEGKPVASQVLVTISFQLKASLSSQNSQLSGE